MPEAPEAFDVLLGQARQGNADALEQLVQQYEFKVRLVARYLLGPALRPHLDSLDLVQSVHRTLMLGLRENKFDISTPEQLVALALTLVRRKAARQWRRLQRQKRLDAGPAETGNLAEVLTSLSRSHDDPARAAQLNDQVRHLCAGLEEPDRRRLELRLHGHSPAEIAGQLGQTANAIYVRLSRLRERLRAGGVLDDWL